MGKMPLPDSKASKAHKFHHHNVTECPPASPLGTLAKVPLELRDLIYKDIFAAGATALTRTSKAIYADTKVALREWGIYRLQIECDKEGHVHPIYYKEYQEDADKHYYILWQQPADMTLAKVRNLHLTIKVLGRWSWPQRSDQCTGDIQLDQVLHELTLSMDKEKDCHVKLQYGGRERDPQLLLLAMSRL